MKDTILAIGFKISFQIRRSEVGKLRKCWKWITLTTFAYCNKQSNTKKNTDPPSGSAER